jgi:Planctomycete cytochrome C
MRQIFSLFIFAVFAASVYASDDGGKDVGFMVPHPVQGVLKTYCYDCHGEKKSKGKIRFDTLSELEIKSRLDLMNK